MAYFFNYLAKHRLRAKRNFIGILGFMPDSEFLREYLQYGGQAVIEGVMMRSPNYFAIACRAPNNSIVVRCEPIAKSDNIRKKLLKIPVLRGSLALLDAIALGSRAMKFAASVQIDPQYADEKGNQSLTSERQSKQAGGDSSYSESGPQAKPSEKEADQTSPPTIVASDKSLQSGAVAATVTFSLAIGLLVFVYFPNLVAQHLGFLSVHTPTQQNLAAGLIKIVFFLAYIYAIGKMPDVHRVFQYHGAEHKAINTLEAGRKLHLEECEKSTRLHPRCGTSFAVIVLLLSLVIMTFVPRYPVPGLSLFAEVTIRVAVEILFLPLIAGLSYELLKFAGTFRSQTLIMIFFRPGLWMQLLTTQEPKVDQIEVALTSLKEVLKAEGKLEGLV